MLQNYFGDGEGMEAVKSCLETGPSADEQRDESGAETDSKALAPSASRFDTRLGKNFKDFVVPTSADAAIIFSDCSTQCERNQLVSH
jgi:hypothetical protein